MTRILWIDQQQLFGEAIRLYLQQAMQTMTVDISRGIDDLPASDRAYDLAVFSIDPFTAIRDIPVSAIRQKYPARHYAACFPAFEKTDMNFCRQEHLSGCFRKTMSGRLFLAGVEALLAGQDFFPADEYASPRSPFRPGEELTPREREVLSALAHGLSNKEIAYDLNIQVVTVKLHVRGICRKLGVNNRTQAALKAQEFRLV
jgi:two-component system nitrate/nitrite response regulator NarL